MILVAPIRRQQAQLMPMTKRVESGSATKYGKSVSVRAAMENFSPPSAASDASMR